MPEMLPAIVLDLAAAPSRARSSMPPSTLPGATPGLPVLPVVDQAAGEHAAGTTPIATRFAGTVPLATTRPGPELGGSTGDRYRNTRSGMNAPCSRASCGIAGSLRRWCRTDAGKDCLIRLRSGARIDRTVAAR
jgi:hypothetical protein